MTGKRRKFAAALTLALSASGSAMASDSPVEEIIVTGRDLGTMRLQRETTAASRLGLSILDTPASVELISREEILAKGDHGALSAVTRATGISASASPGNGGTAVSSRGFAGHNSTIYTYDGTRLYITAGTVTFPADTWTLDRVEVLRGAGSVINGVGALGSTINYVPKSPQFEAASFEGMATGGSYGFTRLALGGGGQLTEQWAWRLDGAHQSEDGWVDRGDEKRKVAAGSLLFQPSNEFSMKFSVDYANVEPAPYWGTPLLDGEASRSHRENNYNFGDGFVEYEDLWSRVRTEWRLHPQVTFRNDTYFLDARREWQNLEEYAFNPATGLVDRAFYLGIIHDQQQAGSRGDFLLEGRLGGLEHRLSVGAEINDIGLDYLNNFSTGGFGVGDSVPVSGFDPGALPIASIPTILDYSTDTRQHAFFIDDVIRLSERVDLVLGGRYDSIDFDRRDHPIAGAPASEFSTDFAEFTWRAGVVYRPAESLSFYAQASTAADPVTSPVSISEANKDFDLSTGRQYEMGLKQQFPGNRAEYTLAWFDIEKEDILTRRPASAVTEQVGRQSAKGLELTLRLRPLQSLTMDFNAAWVDAEFDEFYSAGVPLAGKAPRNVPEKTANLWLTWSPAQRWSAGAGLRYVDGRYGDDANTQRLPAYTVFDAAVDWTLSENAVLTLRGRNLTDEQDYVLSQYTPNQWIFGDPRRFELGLRFAL